MSLTLESHFIVDINEADASMHQYSNTPNVDEAGNHRLQSLRISTFVVRHMRGKRMSLTWETKGSHCKGCDKPQ